MSHATPPQVPGMPPAKSSKMPILIVVLVAAGVLGVIMIADCAGLLLPSLGKARNAARMIKSGVQAAAISQALSAYQANYKSLPAPAANWQQLLVNDAYFTDELCESPKAPRKGFVIPPGTPHYLVLDPSTDTVTPSNPILVIENPACGYETFSIAHQDGQLENAMSPQAFWTRVGKMKQLDGSPVPPLVP